MAPANPACGDSPDPDELQLRLTLELAQRVRYGWVMYPLFVVLFASQSDFGVRYSAAAWSFSILILTAGVCRVWCAQRVLSATEAFRNREAMFLAAIATQSLLWGAFVAYALVAVYGNGALETAVIVGVAGFASAGAGSLAARRGLAYLHMGAQVLPSLVWSFVARERFGWLLLTLVVAFGVFVAVAVTVQFRHTLAMLRTQLLLEMHGQELRRAKEFAEEASSARARFLANMSHEIRTPLNGLLGLAQIIAESELNGDQRALVDSMRHSGDHLLTIVNDILDFSKISAGRMTLEKVPFNLAGLVGEVAVPIAAAAEAKGLRWRLDCARELAGSFLGDPVRIRQVLGNLLNNAVKFTASGEVALELDSRRDGWVRFRVTDTGIGIAPEQSKELFQDFTQADASTTRKFGGTGLGLAISKRLADLMEGSLDVESQPGKGSQFTFEAPLPRCEDGPLTTRPRQAPSVRLPDGRRILVVEDNEVNRTIAARFLVGTGAAVDLAENGKVAVALHMRRPYDLILMDCHMPEMDGFEAAAVIRSLETGGVRVPILAVTASAFPEDRERCMNAGMDGHIAKPLHRAELLETIAAALADSRQATRL